MAFAVADALGQVRLSEQRHPDAITYSVLEELIAEQLATDELIRGIALGIPGVARDGVVEDCDVDALVGVDVAGGVRDRFGINPEVRNDMDFIATGVYTSTPHNGGSLAAMLFPEDGYVGCGFVIDGAVLQGHSGFAGELYRIAEGFGIDRQAQLNALQDRHDFRELAAKAALIVCCTFDPEVIVLLGHGMDTDDLQAIRLLISNAVTESHVRHARRDRVDLRRSHLRLGDDRQPCRGQPASSGCGVRAVSRSTAVPFDWSHEAPWPAVLEGANAIYVIVDESPHGVDRLGRFLDLSNARGVQRIVLLSARDWIDAASCTRPGTAGVPSSTRA
ncbi:ROK family protein, partial [Nostocoides australiense]|nr:ROK family protein [Tetrasphaera australiensis]